MIVSASWGPTYLFRYTRLRIHALSAAIPQAMMLLHALLDILPYPRSPRGLWYEVRTDSVECTDEVEDEQEAKEDVFSAALANIGAVEAAAPKRATRLKVMPCLRESSFAQADESVFHPDRPPYWPEGSAWHR